MYHKPLFDGIFHNELQHGVYFDQEYLVCFSVRRV